MPRGRGGGPPGDQERALARALGRGMREARARLGWTQARAAREVGLSLQFYGRLERGTALPGLPALPALARALGSSPGALLGVSPAGSRAEPDDPPEMRRLARALRAAGPGALRAVDALLDLAGAPPDPGGDPEANGPCPSCAGDGCPACGGWGLAPT